MRAANTPLDFFDTRDDVRLRAVQVYPFASLRTETNGFFIDAAAVVSGNPIADWRSGDFVKAGLISRIDKKGKLEYGIELEFDEQNYDNETILFVRKLAKRNLLIRLTDDCGTVRTVGPMRLSEGQGDSSDFVHLSSFTLNFTRATKKLPTNDVLNDSIVAVLVSCEIGNGTNTGGGGTVVENEFPTALRVVTIVECSI